MTIEPADSAIFAQVIPVLLLAGVLDQRWVQRNRDYGNRITRNGSMVFVLSAVYGIIAALIGMTSDRGYEGLSTLHLWLPTAITAASLVAISHGNLTGSGPAKTGA